MWFHHIAYTRDSTYVRSHLVVNLAPRNCNHSPPPSQQLLLPLPFMGESRSIHKHLQSYRNFHTPPNPRTHAHHIHVYISISVQAAEMVAPRENSDWQTYRPEFSRIVRCLYLKLMNSTLPYFYISGENSPNTIIYIPGCLPLNGEI